MCSRDVEGPVEYGFDPDQVVDPKEGVVITDAALRRIGAAHKEYREANSKWHNALARPARPGDPDVERTTKEFDAANARLQAVCKQEGAIGIALLTRQYYQQPAEVNEPKSQSPLSKCLASLFSCSCCNEQQDEHRASLIKNRHW